MHVYLCELYSSAVSVHSTLSSSMVWKGKLNGKKDKIPRHPYIPRVNHVIDCVARQYYIYTLLLESHGHRHMPKICIIIQFYTHCTWLHRQSSNWIECNENRLSSVPSVDSEGKVKCREGTINSRNLRTALEWRSCFLSVKGFE